MCRGCAWAEELDPFAAETIRLYRLVQAGLQPQGLTRRQEDALLVVHAEHEALRAEAADEQARRADREHQRRHGGG